MNIYVNRQAVFDSSNEVVAYELLVKESTRNLVEYDEASISTDLLKKVLIDFDINMLAGGKRIYVNFTPQLIASGAIRFLKAQNIIVKVRYNDFNADELKILKGYRHEGYVIAVEYDSFDYETLDTSSVDIIICKNNGLKTYNYEFFNKAMFARNIKSEDEFERAKVLGFSMFSGPFFQEAVELVDKGIQVIPTVHIQLLEELNKPIRDIDIISNLIMRDTKLTYSFLRLVNSVAYFSNTKITSIKTAIIRLGEMEMSNILIVNILKNISVSASYDEIVRKSLKRGKLAQLLAGKFNISHRSDELFLLGMFSLINVIMQEPMKNILMKIPLAKDINDALLGKNNSLSEVLELIIYHESELSNMFNNVMDKRDINFDEFNQSYVKALNWVDGIYD